MQASHFYRCVTCGCVRRRKYHNCVICGKPFTLHPSDTKQCCSSKCASQVRKKHGLCTPKGTPMPPALIEAQKKSQLVKAARERFAKEATKAAHALPEGQPGPQNRTAKKWILNVAEKAYKAQEEREQYENNMQKEDETKATTLGDIFKDQLK